MSFGAGGMISRPEGVKSTATGVPGASPKAQKTPKAAVSTVPKAALKFQQGIQNAKNGPSMKPMLIAAAAIGVLGIGAYLLYARGR